MLYLKILLIFSFICLIECCIVYNQHPQVSFCNHNYVVRAVVRGVKENLAENGYRQYMANKNAPIFKSFNRKPRKIIISRTYHIKIIRIFKTSRQFQQADLTRVMSPGSNRSCGVMLKKGKVYLLAGDVINRELWIDTFSWVQEFKQLTVQIKRGLEGKYGQNCKCQIRQCTGRKCFARQKECAVKPEVWSCYSDYGLCDYSKRLGHCHWRRNPDLNKCQIRLLRNRNKRNG